MFFWICTDFSKTLCSMDVFGSLIIWPIFTCSVQHDAVFFKQTNRFWCDRFKCCTGNNNNTNMWHALPHDTLPASQFYYYSTGERGTEGKKTSHSWVSIYVLLQWVAVAKNEHILGCFALHVCWTAGPTPISFVCAHVKCWNTFKWHRHCCESTCVELEVIWISNPIIEIMKTFAPNTIQIVCCVCGPMISNADRPVARWPAQYFIDSHWSNYAQHVS